METLRELWAWLLSPESDSLRLCAGIALLAVYLWASEDRHRRRHPPEGGGSVT